jgi:predicted GNAT family N-acyltransferase
VNHPAFKIELVDYAQQQQELHAIRRDVFVQEQHVPEEEEWDQWDPTSFHVLARDGDGQPIGTGRLTTQHRISRMAVLKQWRRRGVGEAMLQALITEARHRQWSGLILHAQTHVVSFYARAGFIPYGAKFLEAGIEHLRMRCNLQGATLVLGLAGAVAASLAVLAQANRSICIYSRALDPGLWDHPSIIKTFRRYAVVKPPREVKVLLQDAAAPERAHSSLLGLAQRLSSSFSFRQVVDQADLRFPSAYAINDAGCSYYRPLGDRYDGEACIQQPGRARQLQLEFDQVWDRSRPCSEYRILKI